ncbi:MAG: hypothetical protein LIO93_01640 [Bacteroidales bacterium]|nr:hypothetical protein [Bacteroidales bacterium]
MRTLNIFILLCVISIPSYSDNPVKKETVKTTVQQAAALAVEKEEKELLLSSEQKISMKEKTEEYMRRREEVLAKDTSLEKAIRELEKIEGEFTRAKDSLLTDTQKQQVLLKKEQQGKAIQKNEAGEIKQKEPLYTNAQQETTIRISPEAYVDNIRERYTIDLPEKEYVRIKYIIDTELNHDYVDIYNVTETGVRSSLLARLSGARSGIITTTLPSGKAEIVFTTDGNISGQTHSYQGISMEVNPVTTFSNMDVNGFTYLERVGINTYNSHEQLNVGGTTFISDKLGIATEPVLPLTVRGRGSIASVGTMSMDTYQGNLVLTRAATGGQFINLIPYLNAAPWSIGTLYNTNTFAIGPAKKTDSQFTSPFFVIKPNGYVGIGTNDPKYTLDVPGSIHTGWLNVEEANVYKLYVENSIYTEGTVGSNSIHTKTLRSSDDLSFYTNTNLRMKILYSNGNVAIGNITPTEKLEVSGNIKAAKLFASDDIQLGTVAAPMGSYGKKLYFGERYENSDMMFMARYNSANDKSELRVNIGDDANDKFVVGSELYGVSGFTSVLTVGMNGRVGIGESNPAYTLDVKGKIRAEEVVITTPWADFVFEDDYALPTLKEVQKHIREKKHLPGIPSEAEVKEKGVGVADIQVRLLQKIEELTLYVIRQQQLIEELQEKINHINP